MSALNTDALESQPDFKFQRQKRLMSPFMSKKVPPIPTKEERKPYGEYHTNILFRIMFWWLNPILNVGYKRTLTEQDLFYLDNSQTMDTLYETFKSHLKTTIEKSMKKYLQEKYSKEGKTYDPSSIPTAEDLKDFQIPIYAIPLCLFKTLYWQYSLGNLYKVLSDCTSATTPLLQKKLINFVQMKSFTALGSTGKGVGYAIGVCLMIFFQAITVNHAFHNLQICGAKSKAILTRMLLDKSMSVDARGNHFFPASKVQSMISTDLNRVDLAIGFFPFALTCVFPIAICIGLLIWNVGVSALVGIAIFVANVGLLAVSIPRLMRFRIKAMVFTDKRVTLMKELLKNFKMIKFYSWENSYARRIQDARFKEMKLILSLQSLRNIVMSVSFAMPTLASMATFCTAFDITSGKNAASLFSSLSLFQVLSMQFMLAPVALNTAADMMVSMKKFNQFLAHADLDPEQYRIEEFHDDKLAVKVDNATFEWDTFDDDKVEDPAPEFEKQDNDSLEKVSSHNTVDYDSTEKIRNDTSSIDSTKILEKTAFPGLRNINLEIKKGEFVVVTGSIGAGKSSLLQAISGLMKRVSGKVYVDGDLLLCGYPWVQNATIRDNILFGLPFDQEKYDQVVYACSLQSDFNQFQGGDMTEVGERGITLSGGQKARINLARSVYADKDIILLDDVLSAVDAKVGRHIVDTCLLGLLKDKTRIMATHQLSLIDSADRMIFLNGDGSIDCGTISELKDRNEKLNELLSHQKDKANDSDEELELQEEIESKEQHLKEDLSEVKHEIKEEQKKMEISGDVGEEFEHADEHKEIVRIIGDEERAVNALKADVYINYAKLAFGKLGLFSLMLFVTVAALQTYCNMFTNTWLSFWIEEKFHGRSKSFYMGIYIMFAFLYTFFLAAFFYSMCYFCNRASKYLNYKASEKILHVPMSFMDISPIGRVLNRFTKDTDVLDNEILDQFRQFLSPFCNAIGTIVLCIIYIPWFAIAVPLIVTFYVLVANYYQASAREIKRLEAVKRSLVFGHFNEALSGKETIKAYRAIDRVKQRLNKLIDGQNEAYFLTIVNQRWLGANLSILSFCMVFIISFLCVFRVFNISAASTGLLLTYVINLTNTITMMMRAMTQVENEFNSVERLNHYAFDLVQEAPYEIPENDPPQDWPKYGEIIFKDVSMRYRPELPFVLKNINLSIGKGEKIGFCGRTGAGKSTFMTCLYRISEFEGTIVIDDVDISKLGLHKLRSKLTIIPQDPVLFVGSIRENLDPFGEYSDEELWEALTISGLINKEDLNEVKKQNENDDNLNKFHLIRMVEDDGVNFSIRERQLIALARALVRKTKILILDEATSSVDYATDSRIQKTIATEFDDCTILCIAHRLNTILNYDKIVVMDKGEIVEFDKPRSLFMREEGVFRSMCEQANITIEDFP
ncbi:uncharacterized protein C5L36_0B09350 [Pichia kudriavzevii]|uniref:Oligomycin resistance ATP-dependent permease YOR1 n=1 Tax=Pichia kudriavzevii TaxID=4909 RepID=A0A2U9R305_PICKU|nr:uncharacterized protein C5L36_0B09350 [Pichia kudriavzevii]AWU75694.1 hypothetical protein C5L36_0B09350 [Pichia kudriavzevii]